MKIIRPVLVITLLNMCFFCVPLKWEKTSLKEFGYTGEFWGIDKISLKVKKFKKNFRFEFKAFHKKKKIIHQKGVVNYKSLGEFLNFIEKNNIFDLRSASFSDPNTKEGDLEKLYGNGIRHQSAIIYTLYIVTDNKKFSIKVDDMKNISDERYYELLTKINKTVNLLSFKTVFEYYDFLNSSSKNIKK